ncbi:MAG: hypothetical protein ACRDJU_00080 [Actinomycetota bacterium]
MAGLHAVAGPSGWQPADFGPLRVWVPPGWSVLSNDLNRCAPSPRQGLVIEKGIDTDQACPSADPSVMVTVANGTSPAGAGGEDSSDLN